MRVLKLLLVLFVVLLGALFLAAGLGGAIPMLEYGDAKAYGLPVGAGFLIVAALIAIFWKVTSKSKHTLERTVTRPDGVTIRTREIIDRDEAAL